MVALKLFIESMFPSKYGLQRFVLYLIDNLIFLFQVFLTAWSLQRFFFVFGNFNLVSFVLSGLYSLFMLLFFNAYYLNRHENIKEYLDFYNKVFLALVAIYFINIELNEIFITINSSSILTIINVNSDTFLFWIPITMIICNFMFSFRKKSGNRITMLNDMYLEPLAMDITKEQAKEMINKIDRN